MCLILFAYKTVPGTPLIVAANRDEWFARPAEPAAFWPDHPGVLAGRDLQARGTWLGITTSGRFAALTNFRNPSDKRTDAPSRGGLVSRFLTGKESPRAFVTDLAKRGADYNGFCILAGDLSRLFFYSNHGGAPEEVQPGIHGLSNHLLDTPWPKVVKGRNGLEALLEKPFRSGDYLDLMNDAIPAKERELPQSGVSAEWERSLSSMRILKGDYGTRCSTVLRIRDGGETDFSERTYRRDEEVAGEVHYAFTMTKRPRPAKATSRREAAPPR